MNEKIKVRSSEGGVVLSSKCDFDYNELKFIDGDKKYNDLSIFLQDYITRYEKRPGRERTISNKGDFPIEYNKHTALLHNSSDNPSERAMAQLKLTRTLEYDGSLGGEDNICRRMAFRSMPGEKNTYELIEVKRVNYDGGLNKGDHGEFFGPTWNRNMRYEDFTLSDSDITVTDVSEKEFKEEMKSPAIKDYTSDVGNQHYLSIMIHILCPKSKGRTHAHQNRYPNTQFDGIGHSRTQSDCGGLMIDSIGPETDGIDDSGDGVEVTDGCSFESDCAYDSDDEVENNYQTSRAFCSDKGTTIKSSGARKVQYDDCKIKLCCIDLFTGLIAKNDLTLHEMLNESVVKAMESRAQVFPQSKSDRTVQPPTSKELGQASTSKVLKSSAPKELPPTYEEATSTQLHSVDSVQQSFSNQLGL
ncbi:hypothetical protein [Wolbachia endosymbiont of Pentidionis agamae]|uniref:hypothetical protein n=1 Tax=Wolbachia endosymbiont of Pentidionis agamae TaxID=3110435 RepID=UPI002FD12572